MPLLDPHRFDHLAESEILERIGSLLATAVGRDWAQAKEAPTTKQHPAAGLTDEATLLARDPRGQAILRYLSAKQSAPAQELQTALHLSKGVVGVQLRRLRVAGVCEMLGTTRAARYRLRREFSAN